MNAVKPESLTDQMALEKLFLRYHRELIRFFLRRHANLEEASDMTQDVYCRLAGRQGIAALEFPKAFLFRTADNIFKDRIRQSRARHTLAHVPLDGEYLEAQDAPQDQLIADQQELAALRCAILDLNPRCRQVFLLHRLGNMTYTEISRHCGISVSMVEKHVSRALELCRQKVRERGA